mgnify:CR=1 FL=1
MKKNKKIILTLFGYLVSLSLLVIVFKDTNFERVFEYLKKVGLRGSQIDKIDNWA